MKRRTLTQVRTRLLNHGDDESVFYKRCRHIKYSYAVILKKPLIGYKGAWDYIQDKFEPDPVVVTLLIPAGATVIKGSQLDNKLRTNKAKVLRIIGVKSHKKISKATTGGDPNGRNFTYKTGRIARPLSGFNTSVNRTCASGIHFFLDRAEAVDWVA